MIYHDVASNALLVGSPLSPSPAARREARRAAGEGESYTVHQTAFQHGITMTLAELEAELSIRGIPPHAYSLSGGLPNEACCLERVLDASWRVYYSERGQRTSLKCFASEQEACAYFFRLLTGEDPP